MTSLSPEIPWITDLGWTLVLCFFATAVIAATYAIVHANWPTNRSAVRYWLSCLALLAMAVSPLFVGWWVRAAVPQPAVDATQRVSNSDLRGSASERTTDHSPDREPSIPPPDSHGPNPREWVDLWPYRTTISAAIEMALVGTHQFLPLLVLGWAIYVVGRGSYLLGTYLKLRQTYLRLSRPVSQRQSGICHDVAAAMGVRQRIEWRESLAEQVPSVVAWRRPIVVLPANAAAKLSHNGFRLLVAHELAHIRRYDNLVNQLQIVVETLLFYQPQVWWVSRRIREDREYCCDDVAARDHRERRLLADALLALENARRPLSHLIVAATAEVLYPRIARLMGVEIRLTKWQRTKVVTVGLATICLAAAGLSTLDCSRSRLPSEPVSAVEDSILRSARKAANAASDRCVVVYQKTFSFEQLREKDADSPTIAIPAAGHIAFRHSLTSPEESFAFIIRPQHSGPVAVQVSSNESIRPFIHLQWPGPTGVEQSDTDGGSGRGGDCFCIVPTTAEWIRCIVTAANETPGGILVSLWQPLVSTDCDADYIGPAASSLWLDGFARAQVPSHPNMQPPAIDCLTDIDTFIVWPTGEGTLTFTVNGLPGGLKPYLQMYDQFGGRIDSHSVGTFDDVSQLSVRTKPEAGYYLAIMSRDEQSTGEYILVARFQGTIPTR